MAYSINSHLQTLHKEGKVSVQGNIAHSSVSRRMATFKIGWSSKADLIPPPLIPHPQLFEALFHSPPDFPKDAECAVHLELLEAFHALRVKVLNCKALDTTFGIVAHTKTVNRSIWSKQRRRYFQKTVRIKDDTFHMRRRAKWGYFLEIAVGRFLKWINAFDQWLQSSTMRVGTQLPGSLLPPLDILMVWHAFLLNPRDFEEFCAKHGWDEIRKMPFPWADIHEAIDSKDWSYTQTDTSKDWFCQTIGIDPDLYGYLVMASQSKGPIASLLSSYDSPTQSVPLAQDDKLENEITSSDQIVIDIAQNDMFKKGSIQPLKENVERQMNFVEKMHNHLWICSPAAQGTLRRAVDRYTKFLELFKAHPGTVLVPTLDIDLVWHTHQCSAAEYQTLTMDQTGQYIDHNDKIGKRTLKGGMEKTVELFTVRFGEDYLRCFCWECEASVSAFDDVENGNDIDALVQKIKEDLEYYRMVELARRNGGPFPERK